ncbi:M15 family metallopeptidase [Zooshikella sp. RANM57]|uniref:M15 family metallopeptidase n=1 Tax=Zooshikella sp. RANM57 TaxID=3425863 RepID=UPI003D6F5588
MEDKLSTVIRTPIEHHYSRVSSDQLCELQHHNQAIELKPLLRLKLANCYFHEGHYGCAERMYCREVVAIRLQALLTVLPDTLGIIVFDAFRSIATQHSLFESISKDIRCRYPAFTESELNAEVRKFVAHPDEPSRFAIPPHNSGGAIDLALFDVSTGHQLNFGSGFDEQTPLAVTDYFEQPYDRSQTLFNESEWLTIRDNRRLLFGLMKSYGFVNFSCEWWHFDLGDCLWANELGIDWYYPSMEHDVQTLKE